MKTVPTFTATIYVGLKDTDTSTGCIFGHDVLKQVCQKYCDETGFCVTYTQKKSFFRKLWEKIHRS